MASSIWVTYCLVLSSDFHCKENDGATGAAHLIQTFWRKTRLLWYARLLTLLISGDNGIKVWIKFAAPVVPSFYLKWKSDESTKQYLTQMLLAINWRYWQTGKIHECVWRLNVTSCERFIEIHQVFAKKIGYFSNRPRTVVPYEICFKNASHGKFRGNLQGYEDVLR